MPALTIAGAAPKKNPLLGGIVVVATQGPVTGWPRFTLPGPPVAPDIRRPPWDVLFALQDVVLGRPPELKNRGFRSSGAASQRDRADCLLHSNPPSSDLRVGSAFCERCGFEYRGRFGDYADDPNSVFMAKKL